MPVLVDDDPEDWTFHKSRFSGHEIPDEMWARYEQLLAQIEALRDEIATHPYVHRPPYPDQVQARLHTLGFITPLDTRTLT